MSGVAPASPPLTLHASSRPSTTQNRPLTSHTRRAEAAREAVKWLQVPTQPSLISVVNQMTRGAMHAFNHQSYGVRFQANPPDTLHILTQHVLSGQLALQPAHRCLRQRNRSHSFCSRCQILLLIKAHIEVFELPHFCFSGDMASIVAPVKATAAADAAALAHETKTLLADVRSCRAAVSQLQVTAAEF